MDKTKKMIMANTNFSKIQLNKLGSCLRDRKTFINNVTYQYVDLQLFEGKAKPEI